MAPRTILIVDDEPPARARLRQLATELGDWEVAGEASNGREALERCIQLCPDVVLLDIRMPEMDGIEAARHLAGFEPPPAVIFTTAYDDYAIQAFDAQAIGYLVKPVRRERLERALGQAARFTAREADALGGPDNRRSHICVRRNRGLRLVPVADVLFFQADQKYVTLHLADGEELIDEPLKSLEAEFAEQFARIHRNTLVNLRHLLQLETSPAGQYVVRIAHREEPLAVSRRLVTILKKRLLAAGR